MNGHRKTIIMITVIHRDDVDLSGCSLTEIGTFIDEGDGVGQSAIKSSVDVAAEDLGAELQALGNDGHFFDEEPDDPACTCVEPGCPICDCDGEA